jgi:hypothetical protein
VALAPAEAGKGHCSQGYSSLLIHQHPKQGRPRRLDVNIAAMLTCTTPEDRRLWCWLPGTCCMSWFIHHLCPSTHCSTRTESRTCASQEGCVHHGRKRLAPVVCERRGEATIVITISAQGIEEGDIWPTLRAPRGLVTRSLLVSYHCYNQLP